MNPYEVEHNVKDTEAAKAPRRRPSMSSFFNQLSQIETADSTTDPTWHHNNPHAVPTPVDVSAAYRLLRDQFETLRATGSSTLLTSLIEATASSIDSPPTQIHGCTQLFLDTLERVPRKSLKPDEECPICGEKFLDDEYCLVVVLPCHETHKFDLECVGPWLRLNGTCPLDRKEVGDGEKRRKVEERERQREREVGLEELSLQGEGDTDGVERLVSERRERERERAEAEEKKKRDADYESDGDDGMYA